MSLPERTLVLWAWCNALEQEPFNIFDQVSP